MRATAIIPVKRFGARQAAPARRPRPSAARRARQGDARRRSRRRPPVPRVERVIVVTGERRAERSPCATRGDRRRRSRFSATQSDKGHSEAATLGIVRAKALGAELRGPAARRLPAARCRRARRGARAHEPGRVTVVPDRHGTGTNALLLAPPDAIAPAFGPGSRERHAERAERAGLDGRGRAARVARPRPRHPGRPRGDGRGARTRDPDRRPRRPRTRSGGRDASRAGAAVSRRSS